jgi:hypothetical protein
VSPVWLYGLMCAFWQGVSASRVSGSGSVESIMKFRGSDEDFDTCYPTLSCTITV